MVGTGRCYVMAVMTMLWVAELTPQVKRERSPHGWLLLHGTTGGSEPWSRGIHLSDRLRSRFHHPRVTSPSNCASCSLPLLPYTLQPVHTVLEDV